jgi:hypothetical protein
MANDNDDRLLTKLGVALILVRSVGSGYTANTLFILQVRFYFFFLLLYCKFFIFIFLKP